MAQTVKNPRAMRDTCVRSNIWKISWRREQQPTPVFLPGAFHGERSVVGYSPWGRKELAMTEQLSLSKAKEDFRRGESNTQAETK